MSKKEFYESVSKIQQDLKAPKGQYNSFGKYNYRSCEDIVEGFKRLNSNLVLTISDDVALVGERVYVKATATLSDGENSLSVSGMAREALNKKGMDESQITGSTSSYARKYALNGLFCIDDTKDSDHSSPSDDDMSWVNAIKNNQTTLEEIQDPEYRKYIKGLL